LLSRKESTQEGNDGPHHGVLVFQHEEEELLSKPHLTMEESFSDNENLQPSEVQDDISSFFSISTSVAFSWFGHRPTENSGMGSNDDGDDIDGDDIDGDDGDDVSSSSIIPVALSSNKCRPNENTTTTMNKKKNDDHFDDNDNNDFSGMLKDDIYLDESSSQPSQETSLKTSLYLPNMTCPICLDDYKVRDDIAWSKNDECSHTFHFDCILEWLLKHDECPLCREDFLNAVQKENSADPETETGNVDGDGDGE